MAMTVAELFGDLGNGLGDELVGVAGRRDGISGQVCGLLRRCAGEAVGTVLDIDLGSLVLDGWRKYDEVRQAAHSSTPPGATPKRVRLIESRITSTHKPSIEVYVDNRLVATIGLGLDVEIDVHSLDAELRAGRLAALHTGNLDVRATLSVEEHEIAERTRSVDVGELLPLGDQGLPLVTPAPAPDGTNSRPRLRGLLIAAALIVVFGLGGLADRSFDWTSFWPLGPSGTAGSVRPGSEWFVRSGPSKRSSKVGTVAPGQQVRVACLDRGWAKLLTPHDGSYVYSRGLRLASTPPGCPD